MPPKRFEISRTLSRGSASEPLPNGAAAGTASGTICSGTCTIAGPSASSSTDAAPSRNTERNTSGRPSSSAVGPWKRISPFSMKYAVSAIVSATFTDCSTRMTVVPCSFSACTARNNSATMLGASPSDSSSIMMRRGFDSSAIAIVSICCCPPLRFAAGSCMRDSSTGNISSTLPIASARLRLSRSSHPARRRFSATVSFENTPWPPGTITMPRAATSCGGAYVASRPSNTIAPASAGTTPAIAFSSVDLPAPLVPSSATISPSSISKFTPNSTCTLS